MDLFDELTSLIQTTWPILLLVGGALLVVWMLLSLRAAARRRTWNSRISGVQRRFLLAVQDGRLIPGGRLHDLMARSLRHWPHAPMVFYKALLTAVEEIDTAGSPPSQWPESEADPTVAELAEAFNALAQTIDRLTDPKPLVSRAHRRVARRARADHLARRGER